MSGTNLTRKTSPPGIKLKISPKTSMKLESNLIRVVKDRNEMSPTSEVGSEDHVKINNLLAE